MTDEEKRQRVEELIAVTKAIGESLLALKAKWGEPYDWMTEDQRRRLDAVHKEIDAKLGGEMSEPLTKKQRAQVLRDVANALRRAGFEPISPLSRVDDELCQMIDELDPPKPVVKWSEVMDTNRTTSSRSDELARRNGFQLWTPDKEDPHAHVYSVDKDMPVCDMKDVIDDRSDP